MSQPVLTLNQLNRLIKDAISSSFADTVYFVAEINAISVNRTGHCYIDLIEKSEDGDNIVAQLRATIWAGNYRMIKPYFESVTGQPLRAGIKIMACGQVAFHEVYGMSVNITGITPEYTVGEMALQRKITIDKLTSDGVIDMNKDLALPMLIKNIAVISSPQAAGYGDFVNQLNNNPNGYKFFTYLFEASMQGDEAESSIIHQLGRIARHADKFDCVALIRGGGSKADLSCFDKYLLCLNLCQIPLPIITGIGHDRDESVADIVANTALKTPTAVAQFIIDRAERC
ncbi:MAG: exodeoxyribonuclease VII large subunit, partial [Bacteroidales bacterium]|nr:exodeoxyribonuclease VII large subunit [Bacteroidales bacterium]